MWFITWPRGDSVPPVIDEPLWQSRMSNLRVGRYKGGSTVCDQHSGSETLNTGWPKCNPKSDCGKSNLIKRPQRVSWVPLWMNTNGQITFLIKFSYVYFSVHPVSYPLPRTSKLREGATRQEVLEGTQVDRTRGVWDRKTQKIPSKCYNRNGGSP